MTTVPMFDYIHVSGCACLRDPGMYAYGLAVARHVFVERADPLTPEEAAVEAEDAERRIPDGSCLVWLDDDHRGQGWPCDHRDYRLLALWVEASFDAYSAADFEKHSPIVALVVAERERAAASAATLTAALSAAPWGAQPDGSFVTRRTAHQIASGRYAHELHAPGKQGPLATYTDGPPWYSDGSGGALTLRTREEARAIREEERAKARDAQAQYAVRLRAAGVHLRHGDALRFFPGQEYGSAMLPSGDTVSARGALRAAGLSRQEATALLDAFYTLPGAEQANSALSLSLRGVERMTGGAS